MIVAMARLRGPSSKRSLARGTSTLAVPVLVMLGACGNDSGSGDGGADPDRTLEIQTTEYSFTGDPAANIVAGETIRFVVTNVGELTHEMQIANLENKLLGRTERIAPGGRDEVVVTFDEAGTYQVFCDIDDHFSRGQRAQFTITES